MQIFSHKISNRKKRSIKIKSIINKSKYNRLLVHRTSRHIYVQLIKLDNNSTLVCASTLEKKIFKNKKYTGNKESAALLGKIIARRILNLGIKNVSFDRAGFKYHGRIKALAESARKFGLKF